MSGESWPPDRLEWPDRPLTDGSVALDRMTTADVPRIVEARTDPESQRWLALPRPYGQVEAERYLAFQAEHAAAGGGLVFAVRAGDPALAGSIGLNVGHRPPVCTIGYWAHPDSRGRGLAAAAALLARHAFATWRPQRVEIHVQPGNAASAGVALRAGAVHEGRRRRALPHRGALLDCDVWAFVPGDFTA